MYLGKNNERKARLGAKAFRWDDKPVSTDEIAEPTSDGKADALYVLSFCNLHDL